MHGNIPRSGGPCIVLQINVRFAVRSTDIGQYLITNLDIKELYCHSRGYTVERNAVLQGLDATLLMSWTAVYTTSSSKTEGNKVEVHNRDYNKYNTRDLIQHTTQ